MVKVQGQRFGYRSTDLERRVKAGDRTAILPAVLLYCSMYHDIPMPKWLKRAFIDAFCSGDSGEAGSWDKVFGRPRTKTQFVRMCSTTSSTVGSHSSSLMTFGRCVFRTFTASFPAFLRVDEAGELRIIIT